MHVSTFDVSTPSLSLGHPYRSIKRAPASVVTFASPNQTWEYSASLSARAASRSHSNSGKRSLHSSHAPKARLNAEARLMARKEQGRKAQNAYRKRRHEEMKRQLEERAAEVDELRDELQLARAEIASLKGSQKRSQDLNVTDMT